MLARVRNSKFIQRFWPVTPPPANQVAQPTQTAPQEEQELRVINTTEEKSNGPNSNGTILRHLTEQEGRPQDLQGGVEPDSEEEDENNKSAQQEQPHHQEGPHLQHEGEPHHVEPAARGNDDDDDGLEEHRRVAPVTVLVPIETAGQRRARLEQQEDRDLKTLQQRSRWLSWIPTGLSEGVLFTAQYVGVYYTQGKQGCEEAILDPTQNRQGMSQGTYAIPFISLASAVIGVGLDSCGEGYGPMTFLAYGAYKFEKGEKWTGIQYMAVGAAWIIPTILLPIFAAKTYADQSKDEGYQACKDSGASKAIYETVGDSISRAGSTAMYVLGGMGASAGYYISTRFGFLSGSWAKARIEQDDAADRQQQQEATRRAAQPPLR